MSGLFQAAYNRTDESLVVKWTHCYAKTHQQRCLMLPDMEPLQKVSKLLGTMKNLGTVFTCHIRLSYCGVLFSGHRCNHVGVVKNMNGSLTVFWYAMRRILTVSENVAKRGCLIEDGLLRSTHSQIYGRSIELLNGVLRCGEELVSHIQKNMLLFIIFFFFCFFF